MVKKTTIKPAAKVGKKVDFEPNKMTLVVAVAAVTCLVLVAIIASQP